MPKLDGTGPTGKGPLTGRGRGPCQGKGKVLGRRLFLRRGNGLGRRRNQGR